MEWLVGEVLLTKSSWFSETVLFKSSANSINLHPLGGAVQRDTTYLNYFSSRTVSI